MNQIGSIKRETFTCDNDDNVPERRNVRVRTEKWIIFIIRSMTLRTHSIISKIVEEIVNFARFWPKLGSFVD